MAIPDFVDLILTRLQLNFAEITGIVRSYKQPPAEVLDFGDYPAVIPLVGPMVAPVPSRSAGAVFVARSFVCRLLVAPVQGAAIESDDYGIQSFNDALPFIQRVTDYILDHPRLNTATLPSLAYVAQDVTVQDSGPVVRPGPGGVQYVAIDFTLVIECRAVLSPARIS